MRHFGRALLDASREKVDALAALFKALNVP